MIYYHTPYDLNGNLGNYYNKVMSEIGADDWAVFTDRDVWFPDPHYGELLHEISKQKQYGLLTCKTNRVGTDYQTFNRKYWDLEPMSAHVDLAIKLRKEHGTKIKNITLQPPLSGVLIMLSKEAWLKTKGFKNTGLLGVDNSIHHEARKAGVGVGLMEGMYVWHYYRNGVQSDISHLVPRK